MAKKSPCLKGNGAKDLESGKQLETRSSGGGCSQTDSLPILPIKGHAAIGTYLRRRESEWGIEDLDQEEEE
jgi:hypothetical protein